MSAEYIIDRFGKKVGLNPSDENQRFVILDFLNEAMQSVYEYVDIPGALVEEEFYVAGNKRIAMSRDVQSIRAMREKESQLPWTARNLLSGTGTTPILGSIVQKGKFSACALLEFVKALNSVDFPTLGKPTIPHLKLICFLFIINCT